MLNSTKQFNNADNTVSDTNHDIYRCATKTNRKMTIDNVDGSNGPDVRTQRRDVAEHTTWAMKTSTQNDKTTMATRKSIFAVLKLTT